MKPFRGWGVDRSAGPELTTLVDPEGRVAARVRPGGYRWAAVWRGLGLLGRLERIEREAWIDAGPIPDQHRAVVELADGTRATTRNGAPHGPRRRSADAHLHLAGRRYRWAHVSGTTAQVRRDGTCIAEVAAGRRSPLPGAEPVAGGMDVAVRAPLDRTDELVVVLFSELCGPPGRIGAVRRIAAGLWDSLRHP